MQRIFVSSTYVDLKDYRAAVQDAIRELGHIDISMENIGALDERPKDECLRLIREESDVFVGIYAHRYGSIPKGESKSITELEYEQAISIDLPRFLYLINESEPWIPAHIDKGDAENKLRLLKDRVKIDRWCGSFSNKDQLAGKVAADLGKHFLKSSLKHIEQAATLGRESLNPSEIKTRKEWSDFRNEVYEKCRYTFLAHTIKRSKMEGQKFDISIYLLRHKLHDLDYYILDDVDQTEFFLGSSWGDRVFHVQNEGGLIGISISAYGPLLCTCKVTFKDGQQILLNRYIDFEMESVIR
jgi:hypothetical protein